MTYSNEELDMIVQFLARCAEAGEAASVQLVGRTQLSRLNYGCGCVMIVGNAMVIVSVTDAWKSAVYTVNR